MRAVPFAAGALVLACGTLALAPTRAEETREGALAPPLDPPLRITATFGEYRAGHFHAGIDLSTDEVVGKPVYAPIAGDIMRVRASGVGYGRSLYLKARDGRIFVFGHLDRFDSPIAEYVQAAQDSSREYEQDLWPPGGRLTVRRGQRMAWSGQSGVGVPHLHIEVRRGDMNLNPLTQGLAVTDTRAPWIRAVVLEPMAESSRVEGAASAYVLPRTAHPDTIRAWGRLRVSAEIVDGSGMAAARMAPFAAGYDLDGVPQVSVQFDSVSWDDAGEVEMQYDLEAANEGDPYRLRLWRGEGTAAPLVRVAGGVADSRGALVVEPAGAERVRALTVWARDRAGNADRVTIPVLVPMRAAGVTLDSLRLVREGETWSARLALRRPAAAGEGTPDWLGLEAWAGSSSRSKPARARRIPIGTPRRLTRTTSPDGQTALETWRFPLGTLPRWARTRTRLALGDELAATTSGGNRAPAFQVDDLGRGLLRLSLDDAADAGGGPRATFDDSGEVRRLSTRDGIQWTALAQRALVASTPTVAVAGATAGGAWVASRRLAQPLLDPAGARVNSHDGAFEWRAPRGAIYAPLLGSFESGAVDPVAGMRSASRWYRVLSDDTPLRSSARVRVRADAEPGAALFNASGDRWRFVSATRDSEGFFTGTLRRNGRFAVLRDTIPPRVVMLAPHAASKEPYSWWLRARVLDEGAGLDARGVYFEVDGGKVPTEYDPEDDQMRWRPPRPPAHGEHRVVAHARDRVGNATEVEGRFVIR